MIALLMGVISPALLGYLIVALLMPSTGAAVRFFLGAGIGAGIVSCCFFLSLVAGISALPIETCALVVAGLLFVKRRPVSPPPRAPWSPIEKLLGAVFTLALLAAVLAFLSGVGAQPHGGWDGWVIWNTRARFLSTSAWRDVFSPPLFYIHPDYPLLLPAFIARAWTLTRSQDLLTPALAASLFTFGTIGLLTSSLCALKGRSHGFLAGILLVSTHFFTAQGSAEYADIPTAFFILAACATYALSSRTGDGLWISGLCAALAAWAKNEGWMLIAAIALIAFAALFFRDRRRYFRQSMQIALGMLPVVAVVLYFKHGFAPANDFVGRSSLHGLTALASNPARYAELLQGIEASLVAWFLLPLAGLILCAVFLRFKPDVNRPAAIISALALAIIFAGYCATLIISPYEIHWQVTTALDRLLLQLLPAALFTAFLALDASR